MRIRVESQWRDISVEVVNKDGSAWEQSDVKRFCRAVISLVFHPSTKLYYQDKKGQFRKL